MLYFLLAFVRGVTSLALAELCVFSLAPGFKPRSSEVRGQVSKLAVCAAASPEFCTQIFCQSVSVVLEGAGLCDSPAGCEFAVSVCFVISLWF